jgi:hypothetical protein
MCSGEHCNVPLDFHKFVEYLTSCAPTAISLYVNRFIITKLLFCVKIHCFFIAFPLVPASIHSCQYSSAVQCCCLFHIFSSVHTLWWFLYLRYSVVLHISITLHVKTKQLCAACNCGVILLLSTVHSGTCGVLLFERVECFTRLSSFWWLLNWTFYFFPSTCWTHRHDFSFML